MTYNRVEIQNLLSLAMGYIIKRQKSKPISEEINDYYNKAINHLWLTSVYLESVDEKESR